MLVVNNLKIGYETTLIPQSFSSEFQVGDVVVLQGDNGVGKSTLLKTLCGLIKPVEGNISLEDNVKIGWLDSVKPSAEYLTVENYLSFGLSVSLPEISSLLKQFNLNIELDSFINEISDGQFRKVAICRQLLKKPNVLFLDEPSVYLDLSSKQELIEVIKRFAVKGLVFCSSHDKDFSDQISNKKIVITGSGFQYDF